MATVSVGIREFRENLSTYLLDTDATVEITRHGDTVGIFVPTRPRLSEKELDELIARHNEGVKQLNAAGITEELALEELKRMRKARRDAAASR